MAGNVAILIPSRDRPELLERAAWSVAATSQATTIAYVDEDQRDLYQGHTGADRFLMHFGPRIGPAAATNELVKHYPNYEIFGMMADDMVMRTHGWDRTASDIMKKFKGIGVVSPCHNFGPHADLPMVSSGWIKAVGFYAIPGVEWFFWPTAIALLGEAIDRIYHASESEILVTHNQVRSSEVEAFDRDAIAFARWAWRGFPEALERLRAAIQNRQPALSQRVMV